MSCPRCPTTFCFRRLCGRDCLFLGGVSPLDRSVSRKFVHSNTLCPGGGKGWPMFKVAGSGSISSPCSASLGWPRHPGLRNISCFNPLPPVSLLPRWAVSQSELPKGVFPQAMWGAGGATGSLRLDCFGSEPGWLPASAVCGLRWSRYPPLSLVGVLGGGSCWVLAFRRT